MDSAQKQDAIVTEVTQGTTPSSPAFKLLRSSSITGTPTRQASRSPERSSNRALVSMYSGLFSASKTINMPWVRDAATDRLLESLTCNTFSTNLLKMATPSVIQPFTLEEKYEGGSTDPYRRLAGCMVSDASFAFQVGQVGQMTFNIVGMAETMATTALGSATYASPSPGNDPTTPIDITVNSLFGISGLKAQSLNLSFSNNVQPIYTFGSDSPFKIALGQFTLTGQIQFYFSAAADYSTFMTRQTGQALDITIGSVANYKDEIIMNNVHVFNPDISDPGQTGQHMVTLNFEAAYSASDASSFKWNRNVA